MINRRDLLKIAAVGFAAGPVTVVGSEITPLVQPRRPLAYILVTDSIIPNGMYAGKTNRAWHVFLGHFPNAKQKFENEKKSSLSNRCNVVSEQVIYKMDEFPKEATPFPGIERKYDQYHCFRTLGIP